MPRPQRNFIAGIPAHIIQRGNNKEPCFKVPGDRLRYLGELRAAALRYEVQIHAYVLMTNHVHLLVTPTSEDGVSRMMQFLGRNYVMSYNRIHERTGTLWEGRFRSFLIESERYLFACYRYVELNPVRAGLVEHPSDYPWSSYRTNALGVRSSIVHPRAEWIELGSTPKERRTKYREMFDNPLPAEVLARLRTETR